MGVPRVCRAFNWSRTIVNVISSTCSLTSQIICCENGLLWHTVYYTKLRHRHPSFKTRESKVNEYNSLKGSHHLYWRWQLGWRVNFSYTASPQDTVSFSVICLLEMSDGDFLPPAAENTSFGGAVLLWRINRKMRTHTSTHSRSNIHKYLSTRIFLILLITYMYEKCTQHAQTLIHTQALNKGGQLNPIGLCGEQ